MSYKNEFPDFNEADMPAIPDGFIDNSWCNDMCPNFSRRLPGGRWVEIWVDYPDADHREEFEGLKRFAVRTGRWSAKDGEIWNEGPDQDDFELNTDDWREILVAVAKITNEAVEASLDNYVKILGLGFHIDTRGADYVDGDGVKVFDDNAAATYDADIEALFALPLDPYAAALDAWERAGMPQ